MSEQVNPIPAGAHTVTPVLILDGAAEGIEFYKKAFGAVEIARAPDPSGEKIWHASIRLGDSQIFLSDAMPDMGPPAQPAQLWLYLPDVDAGYQRAVEAGAHSVMPPTDMFWGDRFGKVRDRWGNEWSLAQRVRNLSDEEVKRGQADFLARMASSRQ